MAFSVGPLLEIDTVGSELSAALHEYINGDTPKSVVDNSSGSRLDDGGGVGEIMPVQCCCYF